MTREYEQVDWSPALEEDLREILTLGLREDVDTAGDWTTNSLVPEDVQGQADVVARQTGTVAGIACVPAVLETVDTNLRWIANLKDGAAVKPGNSLGRIEGPARSLLTAERLVLNVLGHLSGIATLTRTYVQAVSHTKARIYDTRKTTPGWRRLEKYAVRRGGGCNHRIGLYEAVLIKDNHLALGATSASSGGRRFTPAEAVVTAREYAKTHGTTEKQRSMIIEVEVDTLEQLDQVLPVGPDIVLLDNMGPDLLRQAVSKRDAVNPVIELEASGGVNLSTVAGLAESGVDRISVGALTHSVICLDIGLDWLND